MDSPFRDIYISRFPLENHGGFHRIALFVDGDFCRDGFEIFRRGEGVANFCAFRAACAFDGIGQHERGIVTARRERIGSFSVETLFVIRHEVFALLRAEFRMVMRGKISSFDGFLADLDELLGFPTVAAEERNIQAKLFRLNANDRHVRVIARNKNAIGGRGFDRGELRFEIFVAAVVIEFRGNRSAVCFELVLEEFCQPFAVIAFRIGEDGDLFRLQSFRREIRHHGSLKRVDETNAENVIAGFGHFRIGGGGRNHRDLVLLANRRGFERTAGRNFAENGYDAIARDQFIDDGGGFAGFGLRVFGDEFELLAEDAARRVDFFDGEQSSFVR